MGNYLFTQSPKYTESLVPMTDRQLQLAIEAARIAQAAGGVAYLPIAHPQYRERIREGLRNEIPSVQYGSVVNPHYHPHPDATLIRHLQCKRSTPSTKVQWEYNPFLDYEGGEASTCPHCDTRMTLATDAVYCPGKNCLLVVAEGRNWSKACQRMHW